MQIPLPRKFRQLSKTRVLTLLLTSIIQRQDLLLLLKPKMILFQKKGIMRKSFLLRRQKKQGIVS